MLVIRSEQMAVFEATAQHTFETRMVEHCFGFQPLLCKVLGEDHVRKVVHDGIGRAATAGFTNRGPARLYLELMLLFGSEFANDPQYPWAAEILTKGGAEDQMKRADYLYRKTIDFQQQVAGLDNAYTLVALGKLPVVARNPLPFSADDLIPGILREMGDIFPQKVAFVGHEALEQLIQEATEAARSFQLPTSRGVGLMATLMFFLGHGCCKDPFFPWIARTLRNPAITNSATRAKRLEHKALTWLDHVLGSKSEAEA